MVEALACKLSPAQEETNHHGTSSYAGSILSPQLATMESICRANSSLHKKKPTITFDASNNLSPQVTNMENNKA
jgi:hypothetical protein